MPLIGWLFIIGALAMIIGSLLLLRDNANSKIPPDKLEKIRERKAEAEQEDEREKREQDDW
ncbi:Protein of unknown function [Marinobacter persicus]|uniref:DUF2897 family protein n=1 Tax=Marinobacter persicus TaxID=930118 RepID=A0A1I3TT96_9GAMM|nr:DUF2897 family protein [Marinobacter persicus]GHD45903.1 hypothetical protein GCM10008110_12280 [Marinobacter persicus]SFJ73559.1 Protein of unknown function [Marinobacter persicus]